MARAKTSPRQRSDDRPHVEGKSKAAEEAGLGWDALTILAFGLSLALVLARATMLETLRDPLDVTPGAQPVPRGPGAAASLVLDLLAWVPALLVLARSALDRTFRVRTTWAHGLLAALAAWAMLSPLWAADRFAAAVSGFHLVSAAVFLWAASQLVTSWRRLRVVGGVCAALLLVHGAQALNYRYVERPQMSQDWQQHREQRLRERGLDPASFAAQQFEAKLLRGEMMGFDASPNTFAAVTVLLFVVTLGVVVQRLADRDNPGWVVVPLAGLALGACIIVWSDSKTAFMTPVIAIALLGVSAVAGGWLVRYTRLGYVTGVACVLVGAAALVAHGLHHGTLFIDSLTFRWRYWVGAARVFAEHPLVGVGWENFGQHYLAARLPIATEEVRDPHNFLVRFATELGVVGGVLCVAWMLRLWWELTRPIMPAVAATPEPPPPRALPALLAVVAAAYALSVLAGVDFGFMSIDPKSGPAFVFLRLLERLFGALVLLAVMLSATVRSLDNAVLDDRPAPWLLRAAVVSLAVFLLHNLVDFAMFEIGPMFLFALLTGGVLGIRRQVTRYATTEPQVPSSKRRLLPLTAVGIVWIVAIIALALPVLIADGLAAEGDEQLRTGSPARAVASLREAAAAVPYNAEYPFREAAVAESVEAVRQAFDRAAATNPMHAGYRFSQGAFEASLPQPDASRVKAAFDAGLAIDPANVPMRLRYAEALEKLNLPTEAKAQYALALAYDDQLDPVEVERLPPAKVTEIREKIVRLGASPATMPSTSPAS